jgi:hypothetical protein
VEGEGIGVGLGVEDAGDSTGNGGTVVWVECGGEAGVTVSWARERHNSQTGNFGCNRDGEKTRNGQSPRLLL